MYAVEICSGPAAAVVADISFFSFSFSSSSSSLCSIFLSILFFLFFFPSSFFLLLRKLQFFPLFSPPVGERARSRRMLIDSMSPGCSHRDFLPGRESWARRIGGGKSEWMSLTHAPPDLWAPAAYAVSLARGDGYRHPLVKIR